MDAAGIPWNMSAQTDVIIEPGRTVLLVIDLRRGIDAQPRNTSSS